MKKIFYALFFVASLSAAYFVGHNADKIKIVDSITIKKTGECVRMTITQPSGYYRKLYDGQLLFLVRMAIINPDGSYITSDAFRDTTEATGNEPMIGFERDGERTFEYKTDNGTFLKRTLPFYKWTAECQAYARKRLKTDAKWQFN